MKTANLELILVRFVRPGRCLWPGEREVLVSIRSSLRSQVLVSKQHKVLTSPVLVHKKENRPEVSSDPSMKPGLNELAEAL